MKPTNFYWQWGCTRPLPDPAMNRLRAARLLRAWRRAARSTAGVRVKRIAHGRLHAYIVDWKSMESAGMFVQAGADAAHAPQGSRVALPYLEQGDPWQHECTFNLRAA